MTDAGRRKRSIALMGLVCLCLAYSTVVTLDTLSRVLWLLFLAVASK
jgi:hypothetical protein